MSDNHVENGVCNLERVAKAGGISVQNVVTVYQMNMSSNLLKCQTTRFLKLQVYAPEN